MVTFLINCSNINMGGALQVAHSFLNEIKEVKSVNFHIILSSNLFDIINIDLFPNNFSFYKYDIRIGFNGVFFGKNSYLDKLEKRINPKTVFSLFGPTYWKPRAWHVTGFAKAQYIYSDAFTKNINLPQRLLYHIKKFIHLYNFKKCSNEFVTENIDISRELKKIFIENEVHTVSNCYNPIFDDPKIWDRSIQVPRFQGITMLTISSNYKHKNLSIIPKVIDYLCDNYAGFKFRFVVTVKEKDFPQLSERHKEHILFLGKVNIYQCPHLYNNCDFMFLPTLIESFSASYPEAMKMRKPILTSNLPFAHSICNNAAAYFDPFDPKNIGDVIYKLHRDIDFQHKLKLNGLKRLESFDNSKKRAKKYLNILSHAPNHSKS